MPRRRRWWLIIGLACVPLAARLHLQSPTPNAQILLAAGKGDVAAVAALLATGADVNADNGHGITPIYYAVDRANVALVKLLLEHRADPTIKDLEYGKPPLRVAAVPWSDVKLKAARAEIINLLIEHGAGTDGESLSDIIRGGYYDAAKTLISRGTASPSYLNLALAAAKRAQQIDLIEALTKAGATDPGPVDSARSPERLTLLAGVYRNRSGRALKLSRSASYEDQMMLERSGGDPVALLPADLTLLRSFDLKVVVTMKAGPLPPPELTVRDGGRADVFTRVGENVVQTVEARAPARTPRSTPSDRPAHSATAAKTMAQGREWPSFRGPGGSGTMDDAQLPTSWDVEKSVNIKWKTPIPGFAHSSPIIWGNRVFLTSAIPDSKTELVFRYGRAGGGDADGSGASAYTKDDSPYSWRIYALDKGSGKILWERVAHQGVPKTARHVMASQANSTPATDGQRLVAFFGSEGLYCYTIDGTLLWKRDLGPLSSGRYLDASYEWNTASSPIIYKDLVILQADLVEHSYIAAFDIKTGRDRWRTSRDEQPSWPTPLLYEGPPRHELVTAAARFARGYDPDTGQELWRLGKHSALPTPTPVAGHGLIFITSGGGTTVQPIYAIRPGGSGDITLKDGETSSDRVVWSEHRGGSYIPTPIVYGDLLYVCGNTGVLTAYEAESGRRIYQQRLAQGGGGTYSASPVAADGNLYIASEDGDVIVIKAGRQFERLAVNPMGEVIMATPAIARGLLVFRMQHHVIAVGKATRSPSRRE